MVAANVQQIPDGWWARWSALLGVVITGYFFLDTQTQSLVYDAIAVAAGMVMFVGILVAKPEPRSAWALLASGTIMLAMGEILYGVSQSVPSPADVLYISAYPLLILGSLGVIRDPAAGHKVPAIAQAIAFTVATGTGAMVLILVPTMDTRGVGFLSQVVALAYPLLDLALIVLLIRAALHDPIRRATLFFVAIAITLRFFADTVFYVQDFGAGYKLGDPVDAGWLLSYALLGAIMLHPSLTKQRRRVHYGRISPSDRVRERQTRKQVPWVSSTQTMRPRLMLRLTGRMLIGLAASACLFALQWGSPGLVPVACIYGGTGSVILFVSRLTS